ncbi:extracellular solute-binding protein [Sphaerisporangium perillae]|uniref:extracellular solute-binding protein n=1 Tax=Sphaerisporangium perillae TaxID=2935860 RepID=UPI00200EDF26|nr:extracellular solute-binding protein [Sphaerisporangium perillae]
MALALVLAGCGGTGSRAAEVTPAPTRTATPAATVTSAVPDASPAASPSRTPTPSPKALEPGEGAVTVLTYRGYAEYGANDRRVNWVGAFERATGCRVNLRFPQTSDQMDRLVAQTAYDVVSAPPEIGGRLISEGKVAPLTTSLVPHYDEIPAWLRSQRSVTAGSQVYGVPYLWGWYATLYDSGKTRPAAAGALYSDRGPVMLKDGPLTIADAALTLKRQRPELGIVDPYELTRPQLDAATELLGERRGGAERSYWKEPIQAVQGFTGGSVRIGRALPYQLDILRAAGRPVKALKGEPTTGWVDSWMISAQAAAPNCAYRWIDWATTAKVQQQASVWNVLAPANPRACAWHSEETGKFRQTEQAKGICAAYRVTDGGWHKKISFAVLPVKDCEGQDGQCTDYAEWTDRWRLLVH